MSYYLKYLLEAKEKAKPIRFRIIFESYNFKTVKNNAEQFKQLALDNGFNVSDFDIHDRPKFNQSSIYFICSKNEDDKIRIADHDSNMLYRNDITINIVSDKNDENENKELVLSKFQKFLNIVQNEELKTKTLDIINNSTFCNSFVNHYKNNPKWFIFLCLKYDIDTSCKNYNWFKIAMQNKCMELSKKYPKFFDKYKETNLYYWKPNERLDHF